VSLDWYPFFVVDYRRDTYHLSLSEDGAYRRLIDEYMLSREPLPNDDAALARILGIPTTEWDAVKASVKKFFRAKNDRLHHKRCEQEIRAQVLRDRRLSERSKKSASTRSKKTKHLASSPDLALCNVSVLSSDPSNKTQVSRSEPVAARARKPTRLPDDWQPSQADIDAAVRKGLPIERIPAVAEKFKSYWVNKSNKDGLGRNWHLRWCTWVANELQWKGGRNGAQTGAHHPAGPYGASKDKFRDAHAELKAFLAEDGGDNGQSSLGLLPST
jgi:uncharacterized protein YdaU (DUF1376 family)